MSRVPAPVRFGDLVYRRLRLRNPWNYKAPLLIALPYYMIAVGRVPWDRAMLGVLAALCTIAGIAGAAYFINDLTDIRADLLAGKDNALAAMTWRQRTATFALFLAAALGPWLYLPFNRITGLMLTAEFGLFVVYCFPPFRLKERGFLGVVADASYAHALPAVLAVLTFAQMAADPYRHLAAFLLALGAWQLALGMRNIVLHQLADHDKDRVGGNRTLAIIMGPARLARILATVLVPLEVAAFCGVAVVVSRRLPWLVPAYAAYALLATWRLKLLGQPLPATLRDALYTYADNFYADWLPLLILGFLLMQVPSCWPLAVLHLLLFRNGLRQSWQDLRGRLIVPGGHIGHVGNTTSRPLPTKRPQRSIRAAAFGVSVCLTVGCVGLLEVWLRHDGRFSSYAEKNGLRDPGHRTERLAEPYLHVFPKYDHQILHKTEFTYEHFANSEGLVGPEIPIKKAPGEVRIVAVGDSFTEGVGAGAEGSYPAVLGRILAARAGPMKYTVINAGVSGSDPVYTLELLRRKLLKYEPDLVLTSMNSSDVNDLKSRGGFNRFAPDGQLKEQPLPSWTWLFDRSHLVRALVLGWLQYDWDLLSPLEARRREHQAIQDLIQSGVVGARLAAAHGFRLIVILHPTWWDVQNGTMLPELVEVEEGLRAAGVDYADLLPFFLAEIPVPVPLEYYWPRDFHFQAKGYEVVARAVYSELQKRDLKGFPQGR